MPSMQRTSGGNWRCLIRKTGHPVKSKTFSKKSLALLWGVAYEAKLQSRDATGMYTPKHATVGQLIGQYMEEVSWKSASKTSILTRLKAAMDDVLLSDFAAQHLNQLRTDTFKGVQGVSLVIYVSHLSAVFIWGRNAKLLNLPKTPFDQFQSQLKYARVKTSNELRTRLPSQQELASLRAYIDARMTALPMSVIMDFLCLTALRAGEVMALRAADYDEINRAILVRDRKSPIKSKSSWVPLVPGAEAIVRDRIAAGFTDLLFPYSRQKWSNKWAVACKRVGVVDLHGHDLRHYRRQSVHASGDLQEPLSERSNRSGASPWHSH